MSVNDLAGGGLVGSFEPEQLFAGEAPIVTDAAPTTVSDVQKYEVLVLEATGLRRPDVVGDPEAEPPVLPDTGAKCVIAAQAVAKVGEQVPYFAAGKFNHEVLVWPDELDTYAKRQAFFLGSDIHIGHIA